VSRSIHWHIQQQLKPGGVQIPREEGFGLLQLGKAVPWHSPSAEQALEQMQMALGPIEPQH
jgi:hypothetical protein